MGKNIYPPGAIFCRTCGYCLHGLPTHRCPECGHSFDPADSKSFRTRPLCLWPKRVLVWGGIPLLLLAVAYSALLGWLYMGWKAEAPARALPQWAAEQKKADPSVRYWDRSAVETEPLLPARWRWMILPACRPWMERVSMIGLEINRRPADLAERLAACRQIKKLHLFEFPLESRDVAAISHLSELTSVFLHDVGDGRVLDDQALSALCRLRGLQVLGLHRTHITDRGLEALTNLPSLWVLVLNDSPAVTDGAVEALCRCKGLKRLDLSSVSVSKAGVARLKAGLPDCSVYVFPLRPAPATVPASSPAAP